MIEKIISGGQTGADRAGLDVGIALNIPIGGYCPKGRKAEDGKIPQKYPLIETEDIGYKVRTELNVLNSDVTMVFTYKYPLTSGTKLTFDLCKKHNKPSLVIMVNERNDVRWIASWLKKHRVKILNIAGNRESKSPGIYEKTYNLLMEIVK